MRKTKNGVVLDKLETAIVFNEKEASMVMPEPENVPEGTVPRSVIVGAAVWAIMHDPETANKIALLINLGDKHVQDLSGDEDSLGASWGDDDWQNEAKNEVSN